MISVYSFQLFAVSSNLKRCFSPSHLKILVPTAIFCIFFPLVSDSRLTATLTFATMVTSLHKREGNIIRADQCNKETSKDSKSGGQNS